MTVLSVADIVDRMDLESYRLKRNLTYAELAKMIGVTQAKQARSYALGHSWPRSENLEKIVASTKGAVTLSDMHKRRLDFLQHEHEAVA